MTTDGIYFPLTIRTRPLSNFGVLALNLKKQPKVPHSSPVEGSAFGRILPPRNGSARRAAMPGHFPSSPPSRPHASSDRRHRLVFARPFFPCVASARRLRQSRHLEAVIDEVPSEIGLSKCGHCLTIRPLQSMVCESPPSASKLTKVSHNVGRDCHGNCKNCHFWRRVPRPMPLIYKVILRTFRNAWEHRLRHKHTL